MPEWTGSEIEKERVRLEREAALLLGLMVFEYSRLDMELGLLLAWSNDGCSLESLTERLNEDSFYKRLKFLEELATARYQG